MAGTFTERIAVLRRMCGMPGDLTASLEVNQVYAHVQHEELSYRHPRGGQAKYLEQPLFAHYRHYLDDYARTVLRDGGRAAMVRTAEHLSDQVELHAPRLFQNLRFSGHPKVTANGIVHYDRPPKRHRLTAAELEAEEAILWPTLPARLKGWIWWHVMKMPHPPSWYKKRGISRGWT